MFFKLKLLTFFFPRDLNMNESQHQGNQKFEAMQLNVSLYFHKLQL